MRFEYQGTYPDAPEMNLRAKLGWEYFFGKRPDWACVKTCDGNWIVTDESCDLDEATIFPDDEEFVSWLDETAKEHLENDPVEFLRYFSTMPELLTEKAVAAMKEAVEEDDREYTGTDPADKQALEDADADEAEGDTENRQFHHKSGQEPSEDGAGFCDREDDDCSKAPEEDAVPKTRRLPGRNKPMISRKNLCLLLKVNDAVNRLHESLKEISGNCYGTGCVMETFTNLSIAIQDLCGIPHDDESNDRLFSLLDSDVDMEKKADLILNWKR